MAITQTVPNKTRDISKFVSNIAPHVRDVLPRHMTPERQLRLLSAMLSRDPKLAEATSLSLATAIVNCSMLGFEPNTPMGYAWILPYKNNKARCTEAQLIIGYKGYIQLFYQSGMVDAVWAELVHANDKFSRTLGTNRGLHHEPAVGDRGEIVGAYACAAIKGTAHTTFVYMNIAEILDRKAFSRGSDSQYSPWNDPKMGYPAMVLKTPVRSLAKWVPMSTEDKGRSQMALASEIEARIDTGDRDPSLFLPEVVAECEAQEPGGRDIDDKAEAVKKRIAEQKSDEHRQLEEAVSGVEGPF